MRAREKAYGCDGVDDGDLVALRLSLVCRKKSLRGSKPDISNPGDCEWQGGSATHDELVDVDDGPPELVLGLVVEPHADFTEITVMVLVEVGAVVVLTTGETATTRMFPVLANATVTGADVAAVLAGLGEAGRHLRGAQSSNRSAVGPSELLGPLVSRQRGRLALALRHPTPCQSS